MLVLHLSSNCDICYDTYGQDNPPSTIPCGHIFCYRYAWRRSRRKAKHLLIRFRSCYVHRCLPACRPSVCPLCRKKFSSSHVTKLITADVWDGGSEATICSPISATPSTSSWRLNERLDSLREKDFDDRVAAHIKETMEIIKEATERVCLHQEIETTLRARLAEMELERDTLLS